MSGFGYNILGFGGGGVAAPPEVDNVFNSVTLLSHFEGANNGVNDVFDDGSADNLTISTAGNVTQGTFSPFAVPDGDFSFVNAATDDDSFKVNSSDNFDLTDPFTVEGWVFLPNLSANKLLFGRENNYWITHDYQGIAGAAGKFGFNYQNNGNWAAINASANTVAGQWYFLQATYVGTTATFYVNGTSQGTSTIGTPASNTDKPFYVLSGPGDGATATASNVRVSSVARASTLPTTAFISDSDTELLVCQSRYFIDNGPDGHTITVTAGTSISSSNSPFLSNEAYDPAVNGASAYFDTTHTGAILVASPPAMTSTFTYECWVYPIGNGTYKPLLNQGPRNGSSVSAFYIGANTKLVLQIADSNAANKIVIAGSANDITLGQWNHVVLTHLYASSTNSTYKIYSNGIEKSSLIHTGGFSWATGAGSGQPLVIGRDEFEGEYGDEMFVQDARLVVGSLVYTGNFTPPTAPLTAITNTKLLLNMADGQIIDIAQPNNMVLYNNAKLSTAQAKFGDTSLLLAGSTGNGSQGGGSVQLEKRGSLSGPFTIETWAWADDTTNAFMFCQGQYRIELGINGNTLRMYKTSSITGDGYINFFTGGEFSVNTWHHVALVRDTSNVIKCYLNGTASGTTLTDATAFPASDGVFSIGSEYHSTSPNRWHGWDGYLDEFRISEFARYTNNFTPPTKPFADKGQ